MDLLIPSTGLLFWMTITFLVVLGLLWKFGFPVIVKMVNERKAFIDGSLKKAHEANEKLANIKAEGEQLLQEAREKQVQILKEAMNTRDAIVSQAQDKAKAEGSKILSEAKAEIETEKQNAIRDIRSQVAELSVMIAGKVLRQNLSDDKQQMEMINCLLDEVSVDNKNKQ
jgi:F-type H+-transporting ATPase subunit b